MKYENFKTLLVNQLVDTYLEIFDKLMKSKRNVVVSPYGISTLASKYIKEEQSVDEEIYNKINHFFNADLDEDASNTLIEGILDAQRCAVKTYRFKDTSDTDRGIISNISDTTSNFLSFDYPMHSKKDSFIELINNLVDTGTSGLIPKILDTPLPDSINDFWLNIVNFDKQWGMSCILLEDYVKFNNSADEKDFFSFEHTIKKYKTPTVTCYKIPYCDDYSMLVYVSDKNNMSILEVLTSADIKASLLTERFHDKRVIMSLPCFDIKSDINVNDILHLSANTDMKQTARVICNERGTKAVAATSMAVKTTSFEYPHEIITVDEPFVFAIQDNKSKLPIFLGYIEQVD